MMLLLRLLCFLMLTGACLRPAAADDLFLPNYAHAPTMDRLLHWAKMPVRVFVATHDAEEEQNAKDALAGFDAWVRATNGVVRYRVVNAPGDADLTVRFVPSATVPGRNGAVGMTDVFFYGTTLRRAEMWLATGDTRPEELRSVAAHEFGHALGIRGHSNTSADLMFPSAPRYYSADNEHLPSPVRPITPRDLNTLKLCYPSLFVPRSPG